MKKRLVVVCPECWEPQIVDGDIDSRQCSGCGDVNKMKEYSTQWRGKDSEKARLVCGRIRKEYTKDTPDVVDGIDEFDESDLYSKGEDDKAQSESDIVLEKVPEDTFKSGENISKDVIENSGLTEDDVEHQLRQLTFNGRLMEVGHGEPLDCRYRISES